MKTLFTLGGVIKRSENFSSIVGLSWMIDVYVIRKRSSKENFMWESVGCHVISQNDIKNNPSYNCLKLFLQSSNLSIIIMLLLSKRSLYR